MRCCLPGWLRFIPAWVRSASAWVSSASHRFWIRSTPRSPFSRASSLAAAAQQSLAAHRSLADCRPHPRLLPVDSLTVTPYPAPPFASYAQTLAPPCRPASATNQTVLARLLLFLPDLLRGTTGPLPRLWSSDKGADLLLASDVNDDDGLLPATRRSVDRWRVLPRPPRASWRSPTPPCLDPAAQAEDFTKQNYGNSYTCSLKVERLVARSSDKQKFR